MDKATEIITSGHNCLILGQAGSGKTSFAKRLEQLEDVKVVCPTGIAATQYANASTIHKYFLLRDGRDTVSGIVQKILNEVDYVETKNSIRSLKVLVIDEISMVSKYLFETVEEICRLVRNSDDPFGGIQVVLVGDVFQLRPVPNPDSGDSGEFFFSSPLIRDHFPHRVHFNTVFRQSEEMFTSAVNEVSRGMCSEDTHNFLMSLTRNIDDPNAIRLFARNFDVDCYNSERLLDMPGHGKVYRSTTSGNKTCKYPVENAITLKEQAPIMVIRNLSPDIVNGLKGVVTTLESTQVRVYFPSLNRTEVIKPYKFIIYSKEKSDEVGCRTQLPIKLAFASTVHKAQGLTFESCVVDCQNMCNPGQIGVAIGRVTDSNRLQMLNFKKEKLAKQPPMVEEFFNSFTTPGTDVMCESFRCCRYHERESLDVQQVSSPVPSTSMQEAVEEELDRICLDVLEEWEQQQDEEGEKSEEVVQVESRVDVKNFAYSTPVTDNQKLVNTIINSLDLQCVNIFVDTVKHKFVRFIQKELGDTNVEDIKNKHFSGYYKSVAQFLLSDTYRSDVERLCCLQNSDLKPAHFRVAYSLVEWVRHEVVREAATPILITQQVEEEVIEALSSPAKAKIRYIGGWAVASVRAAFKSFVLSNLFKKSKVEKVRSGQNAIRILEETIADEEELLRESQYQETLAEVIRRQNSRKGLTHITDDAMFFFIALDKSIRALETEENLYRMNDMLYTFILNTLRNSTDLFNMFKSCLETDHDEQDQQHVYSDICLKFVRMSSRDFRNDLYRKLKVEKKESLRKEVKIVSSSKKRKVDAPATES